MGLEGRKRGNSIFTRHKKKTLASPLIVVALFLGFFFSLFFYYFFILFFLSLFSSPRALLSLKAAPWPVYFKPLTTDSFLDRMSYLVPTYERAYSTSVAPPPPYVEGKLFE